jgi:hypothetical protein
MFLNPPIAWCRKSNPVNPTRSALPSPTARLEGGPAQKNSRQRPGWRCRREVAGTGTELTRLHSVKHRVDSGCDAKCDAISADRIELLARAVVLVAGMKLAEAERAAVLARVAADLTRGSDG